MKRKKEIERERKRERERVKKQRVILPNGLAGRVLFCAEATGVKKKWTTGKVASMLRLDFLFLFPFFSFFSLLRLIIESNRKTTTLRSLLLYDLCYSTYANNCAPLHNAFYRRVI